MSKVMYVFEEPKTCSECCFLGPVDYIRDYDFAGKLYRRISKCKISPKVSDPWKEVHWLAKNKPDWCPLKSVKEEE